MPHRMFLAHVKRLDAIRARRMLDQAQSASAPHLGKEGRGWWDRTIALARGDGPTHRAPAPSAAGVVTFNGVAITTSEGWRRGFARNVAAGVER